jgi:DNA-binding XRE family transcriptional regulator
MTLKTIREALGISQVELDRRAGLTRGSVGDIESGRNSNPSFSICVSIAEALRRAGAKGVDAEQLFASRVAS